MERWSRHEPWDLERVLAFGRFVRRARQCAGLSQQRLADLSGVSQSVISRLERGLAPHLGLSRLLAIQGVLGGCLPLGVCPHEHTCIWQPRSAGDRAFLQAPGTPSRPWGSEDPYGPPGPFAEPIGA
jgi:hypothetical protein